MTDTRSPAFEDADEYARELSERQREVLALIARGHTNPEIADQLGISLDGAKWHVSELLSKLGLESREELVEFWQWRRRPQRRLSHAVRGMLAFPALKLAGRVVSVALIAGIGIGAWALFAGSSGRGGGVDDAVAVTPFVLEAKVHVTSQQDSLAAGADIAGQPGGASGVLALPPRSITSTIHWWRRDDDHWKWTSTTADGLDGRTLTMAADGKTVVNYDDSTNTYSTVNLSTVPDGAMLPSPGGTSFLGPITYAKTADEFVEELRTSSKSQQVEITGHDTVLGHDTVVISMPAGSSSSSGGGEESIGTMRIWLDPERMYVLKVTSDFPGAQSYEMDVTSLDDDADVSSSDIAFQLPKGAHEVKAGDGDNTTSSATGLSRGWTAVSPLIAPAGFLTPEHEPTGLALQMSGTESGSGANSNTTVAWNAWYTDGAGPTSYLHIEERARADGLPVSLRSGTPVAVNSNGGWRDQHDGATTLAWEQDGVSVLLTSHGIHFDEVLKVAESMTGR